MHIGLQIPERSIHGIVLRRDRFHREEDVRIGSKHPSEEFRSGPHGSEDDRQFGLASDEAWKFLRGRIGGLFTWKILFEIIFVTVLQYITVNPPSF